MAFFRLWSLLILAAGLAIPPFAEAAARPAKPEKSAVLVLRLEGGGLPDDLVQKLDAATREVAKASLKGAKLLPAPVLEFEAMRTAAGCADDGPECLASVGGTLGAHDVVRVVVSGNVPKAAHVTITTVRVKDRHAKVHRADIENLDAGAIEEFRFHVTQALSDKKVAPPPGSIALQFNSEFGIDGVDIFLDDRKSPPSALKSLPAGEHTLQLHKEGFETFTTKPLVRPGRETVVQVQFVRAKPIEVAETNHAEAKTEEPKPPEPERTTNVTTEAVHPEDPKLDPGSPMRLHVEPPPEEKPRLIYTWIFGTATVLSAVAGTVFGILVLHEQAKFDRMCGGLDVDGHCKNSVPDCNGGASDQVCVVGKVASIGTYIAWPAVGVFAALSILAFYQEGGFTGDAVAPVESRGSGGLSIGVVPGGAGAMFTTRF